MAKSELVQVLERRREMEDALLRRMEREFLLFYRETGIPVSGLNVVFKTNAESGERSLSIERVVVLLDFAKGK